MDITEAENKTDFLITGKFIRLSCKKYYLSAIYYDKAKSKTKNRGKKVMNAWEELAKEEYERLTPKAKFDGLEPEMKKAQIANVKEKVVHRLNILTDSCFGKKRFWPVFHRLDVDVSFDKPLPSIIDIPWAVASKEVDLSAFVFPDHVDTEQREMFKDKLQEYEDEGREIQGRIDKLETEEKEGKEGKALKDIEDKIKTAKQKYDTLCGKARDLFQGFSSERFAELNASEKELFGILLREIKQKDLEKIRNNRWEVFNLGMRKKIIELLDELCNQKQWAPVGMGMGMELNMNIIEYKLLYPKQYRLFRVTEMIMDDEILQKIKDDILEMIDDKILRAYKMLSKERNDVESNDEFDLELQKMNEQIEETLKKKKDTSQERTENKP